MQHLAVLRSDACGIAHGPAAGRRWCQRVPRRGSAERPRPVTTVVVALLVLAGLVVTGCAGKKGDADTGPRSAVQGTVSLKAKPLSGAMVTFIPVTPGLPDGGSGRTDAEGRYKLITPRGAAGLRPGDYRVVVSQILGPDGKELPAGESPYSSGGKEALPPTYSDATATTLKASVSDNPDTQVDFALK